MVGTKREVEVVEFIDPFIKRRASSNSQPAKKIKLTESEGRKGAGGRNDVANSIFCKIDKKELFQQVLEVGAARLDPKARKQLENDKLRKLGCDVREKKYINYKQLKERRKEEMEYNKKMQQNRDLSELLANNLSNKTSQLSKHGLKRKSAYLKERKRRQEGGRSNKILGDLDAPKMGKFRNGVLRIRKDEFEE